MYSLVALSSPVIFFVTACERSLGDVASRSSCMMTSLSSSCAIPASDKMFGRWASLIAARELHCRRKWARSSGSWQHSWQMLVTPVFLAITVCSWYVPVSSLSFTVTLLMSSGCLSVDCQIGWSLPMVHGSVFRYLRVGLRLASVSSLAFQ